MKRWLFPEVSRSFRGQRWTKISFRTLHLIAICGLGSWALLGLEKEAVTGFIHAAWLTGIVLVALELFSNAIWLIQVRGIAVLFKLILITAMLVFDEWVMPLFVLVMVISGLISHAPGNLRYYSPIHGRRVDSLPNAQGGNTDVGSR